MVSAVFVTLALAVTVLGVGVRDVGGGAWGHALAMLPYGVIHVATVRRPGLMPSWLVFLAGVSLDLLTHGPLGYWALVYLTGLFIVRAVPEIMLGRALGRAGLAVGAVAAMGLLQYGVMFIYQSGFSDVAALGFGLLAAAAVLAVVDSAVPYGRERVRGFGAATVALRRGEQVHVSARQ